MSLCAADFLYALISCDPVRGQQHGRRAVSPHDICCILVTNLKQCKPHSVFEEKWQLQWLHAAIRGAWP